MQLIDRYEIVREIGKGGMATVYLARDPRFERDVAVKILPSEFMHDDSFQTRFDREAKTIAHLEHSAIVPVYDYGEFEDQPYLVMRYLDGGSLRERIETAQLKFEDIDKILFRIGSALEYAHKKSIIHRDLKPGNILFDEFGDSYLADFGIAKLQNVSTNLTGTGLVGTPAYMSPEQLRSKVELDGRSDIYSLGIVLYEMLTGQKPYDSDSPTGVITAHLTDPIPDVRVLRPDLPIEITGLIYKAMAKERDERFSKAPELASTFDKILKGMNDAELFSMATQFDETLGTAARLKAAKPPASAPAPDRIQPVEKKSDKTKKAFPAWLWLIGIGGLAAFFVVFLIFRAILDRSDEQPPSTVSEIPIISIEVTSTTNSVVPTEAPTDSPVPTPVRPSNVFGGGSGQISFASDRSGEPQIWIADIDGSDLFQLTDIIGGVCQPAWSPDGSQLVVIAPCREDQETYTNTTIWLMDADGGGLRQLTTGPGDYDPAWSPDGQQIAFTSSRDGRTQIYLVTVSNGKEEPFSNNTVYEYDPMWSPEGDKISFIATSSGSTIIVVRAISNKEVTQFTRETIQLGRATLSPDGRLYIFNQLLSGLPGLVGAQVADQGFKSSPVFDQIGIPMRDASFSPDAVYIAYESWPDGVNHDIFIATASGQVVQQITTDSAFDFDPAWRP